MEESKIIMLDNLSLADLVALHNNYWLSKSSGARFQLLREHEFEAVEDEIGKKLSIIDFKTKKI
ncbi:MAG: hypothetical protein H7X88_01860 [Gloeobacteraceae cyanobacterium ES-bin-316]|nr:hypothetical protein [Ferruginibacter sp.]